MTGEHIIDVISVAMTQRMCMIMRYINNDIKIKTGGPKASYAPSTSPALSVFRLTSSGWTSFVYVLLD